MFVETGWMSERPVERKAFQQGNGAIIKFCMRKSRKTKNGIEEEVIQFTVFAKGDTYVLPVPGTHIVVHGDTRGREYNDKIYNDYIATAIYVADDNGVFNLHEQPFTAGADASEAAPAPAAPIPPANESSSDMSDDDIPF